MVRIRLVKNVKCMAYEVEDVKPRSGPKKTLSEERGCGK